MSLSSESESFEVLSCQEISFQDSIRILIVCDNQKYLRDLSTALVEDNSPIKRKIHVITQLPFPDAQAQRKFYFIVFVIDASRRASLLNIKNSIARVDANFSLGRSYFIAVNSGIESENVVDLEDIFDLEKQYKTAILHGNLNNPEITKDFASKILRKIEITSRLTVSFIQAASGLIY